jgi:hypothetical protein
MMGQTVKPELQKQAQRAPFIQNDKIMVFSDVGNRHVEV